MIRVRTEAVPVDPATSESTFRVFILEFPRHPVDWCLRHPGPVDLSALQRAVDRLVDRHQVLRTSETADEPLRVHLDKAAALWRLWTAAGGVPKAVRRCGAQALMALWPRTKVQRSQPVTVKLPSLTEGRIRDPRWDWATHDQLLVGLDLDYFGLFWERRGMSTSSLMSS